MRSSETPPRLNFVKGLDLSAGRTIAGHAAPGMVVLTAGPTPSRGRSTPLSLPPYHRSMTSIDPYAEARELTDRLEAELKRLGRWREEPLPATAYENMGA